MTANPAAPMASERFAGRELRWHSASRATPHAAGAARPADLVAVATSASSAVRQFHAARVKVKSSLRVQGTGKPKPTERTDEQKQAAVARAKERLALAGLA